MFCDIADSTPLAARVGAEAMHGLLNRFFEVAVAEVHRYEGTINQFLGDGFMALFGAPMAHEDHARRALLAASAIQRRMRDAPGALRDVRLRMGLNTGTVVVGKIGDNLPMIQRETSEGLELKNSVDIIVATSDFRVVRGRSYLLAVMDEVAFWRDEDTSLNPDREILRSLSPGLTSIPQSLLIGITSPFKRSGLAYDRWTKYFGKDDPRVLVIHAPTPALNPSLDESEIAAATADDPLAARSDFLAEWRDDIAGYIPRELVERCVDRGVMVRPYERGWRYHAFLDAAEGLSAHGDSFAAAIAHNQRDGDSDLVVLDWLRSGNRLSTQSKPAVPYLASLTNITCMKSRAIATRRDS
jgi:hypothetical protein